MLEAFEFGSSIDAVPPAGAGHAYCVSRIDREDLKLLTEIGVHAVSLDKAAAARPIFELLDQEQRDNAAGAIGLALIEIATGHDSKGIARLRRAISEKRRCVPEAKAVLCIVLRTFGHAAEARLLQRDLLRGPDCGARRLIAGCC